MSTKFVLACSGDDGETQVLGGTHAFENGFFCHVSMTGESVDFRVDSIVREGMLISHVMLLIDCRDPKPSREK